MPAKTAAYLDKIASKKVIVADFDGTLAISGQKIDTGMVKLVLGLLRCKKLVVLSSDSRICERMASFFGKSALLRNLYLFPMDASEMYQYTNGAWNKVYSEQLTKKERKKILSAFAKVLQETSSLQPKKIYGKQIEDGISQVIFSALGRGMAPVAARRMWDQDRRKRLIIRSCLKRYLPEFDVQVSGMTSINIKRPGIDKAYGIRRIMKALKCSGNEMCFIGNELYRGGNDYAARKTGIFCVPVDSVGETKRILRYCIKYNKRNSKDGGS